MPSGIIEKVIARLNEMGHKVIHYGNEYRSQCPAHRGTNLNFAFSEGDDGRLLATCHSKKCSYEEIVKSLGLETSETMGTPVILPVIPHEQKEIGPGGKKVHRTLKAATLAAAFGINSHLQREPDLIYRYNNIDGTENLFACRWNITPEEQQRLDISDHKQIRYVSRWGSGYIVGTDPRRIYPLCHIDEIAQRLQTAASVRLYICEGEKATEKAWSLGLTASCTPFGSESAGRADWKTLDKLAVQYKRKMEIVVLPDNDEAGIAYAQSVLNILRNFESKPVVRIVPFADNASLTGIASFPAKGDICEFCDLLDSKSTDEIRELIERIVSETKPESLEDRPVIEATPPRELECICDESVETKDIQFAWNDRFPYGKVMLVNGLGSAGKTFLICYFMATITAGSCWPDGQKADKGCVIYFTTEDGIQDTISKRFRDNGGYSPFMFYYQQVANNVTNTSEEFVLQETDLLERLIDKIERERGPVRMVVFDPITAFTGKIDENKNNQVRSILAPLIKLAEKKNFVCIGIVHPKKGASLIASAAEGVAGSSGYVNTARRVWQVFYDKENGIRYMLIAKNNLHKDPKGLAYVINDGIVSFTDTDVDMDADEYLARQREKFLKPPGKSKRSNIDEVEEWLSDFLSSGAMPSGQYDSADETTVFGAGNKKGYTKNSIYQAKKNLGIRAYKGVGQQNDTWYWSLPIDDSMTSEFENDFKMFAAGD